MRNQRLSNSTVTRIEYSDPWYENLCILRAYSANSERWNFSGPPIRFKLTTSALGEMYLRPGDYFCITGAGELFVITGNR